MFVLLIFLLTIIFAAISILLKKKAWETAAVESFIILVLTAIYGLVDFRAYTGGIVSSSS